MSDIEPILAQYAADWRYVRIEPLGSAGGMSGAQFWRIATPSAALGLRRWPAEHPAPDRLRLIHAVLNHAARHGVTFLPVPIAARNGQSFIEHDGHLWELTPWLPGVADFEDSPSDEKLRAAMTALAQFHTATAEFNAVKAEGATLSTAGAPAIDKRLARLRELANGGIDELSRAITDTKWPEFAPLARTFIAELHRALSGAIAKLEPLASLPLPLQPCIRDVWHDHILFMGERVSGIVDFGGVDIDTPTTDIARLLGSLAEDDRAAWRTGVAAYSVVRPLSQNESLAVPALDAAGTILATCNWIRWIYLERREFENRAQVLQRFKTLTTRCKVIPQPLSGEIA